ncbi:MAG: beta-ketoacyl-[acyl-carrier-protein] synthase family protein [Phenylobacterium sp.]|uniref:beta-ketoacyl-[acyl-carrier-protein] synthase family protein n=1 Tax=Phenylobacterium sp. TaxID=1871053 RepID=UPI002734F734|nr:beta-ketoacyl-[acyl-carrier-protein] synthase family protein [Phenylobacterium sp.]MDP3745629.1 beta-ketoacyl-[acyl-carrier-protein] synthase family protein [Phenylobacterium sp.]
MKRVAVTGMGCVSALGNGVRETWSSAIAGQGGARPITLTVEGDRAFTTTAVVAALRYDPLPALMARFGRKPIIAVDRFANLAAAATAEALDEAGLGAGSAQLRDAAIMWGACSGGLISIEQAYERMFALGHPNPHPLTVPRLMVSAPASHISILFGVRGLCLSISSACASSAHAIAEGMYLIRSGRAQTVIAGGSDASLSYGGLQSWKALQAISEVACRPFSRDRDGTILGEGAATLILEDEAAARERGAHILCYLTGAGATSDASHMTQPDAESAAAAVRAAHAEAGLPVDEPILISAHGTGTLLNDRMETQALREVYGRALDACRVMATKSAHGHMLGAGGAMEVLLGVQALIHQEAIPTLNFLDEDSECPLPLVLGREAISYRALLSTSFAFGGLNSALIAQLPET